MNRYIVLVLGLAAALMGCPSTPSQDVVDVPATDTPISTDAPATDVPGNDVQMGGACADYCTAIMSNCTGANAQYADMAQCVSYCTNAMWPAGTAGAASGNSVACRTYHAGTPAMTDPGMHCPHAGPSGGDVCGTYCENFCQLVGVTCTGANAQYTSQGACMTACAMFPTNGRPNDVAGDSVQCRIYHGGAPAMMDPAMHCPHTSVNGGGVCGGAAFNIRTDAPETYTRVDRMGMPAVATALVSSAQRNAYNDANPAQDAMGTFAAELITNLTALHTALDDDLRGLNLTPCSMLPAPGGTLPQCLAQEVAPGVNVASLVLPDTLNINPSAPAGFPNGRRLPDQVIDVTLAVIMLQLGGPCGAGTCSATTLASVPVNPARNDVNSGMFPDTFPYLHPAQAP